MAVGQLAMFAVKVTTVQGSLKSAKSGLGSVILTSSVGDECGFNTTNLAIMIRRIRCANGLTPRVCCGRADGNICD